MEDLEVAYPRPHGPPVVALPRLSFRLGPGETLGVSGPSGSGKTTLALALAGLLPPGAQLAARRLELGGASLLGLSESAWRKRRGAGIGCVFQQPFLALSPWRRVGDQLADVLLAHRKIAAREAEAQARALLEELAIGGELADAFPHQLSGGQRQRIVFCQAVIAGPTLLVADEPTASLDAESAGHLLDFLARLRRQLSLSLLLISHDRHLLDNIADRRLVLDEDAAHPSSSQEGSMIPTVPEPGEEKEPEELAGNGRQLFSSQEAWRTPTIQKTEGNGEPEQYAESGRQLLPNQEAWRTPTIPEPGGEGGPENYAGSGRHPSSSQEGSMSLTVPEPGEEKEPEELAGNGRQLFSSQEAWRTPTIPKPEGRNPSFYGFSPLSPSSGRGGQGGEGPSPPLLAARGVAVELGRGRFFEQRRRRQVLLGGVDFELLPGEVAGLYGPSGSGKTTLLRCLAGLLEPTRGRVLIGGADPWSADSKTRHRLRRSVQMVGQDPARWADPRWPLWKIVGERLASDPDAPLRHSARLRDASAAALEALGLGKDLLDRRPAEVSGGQLQRALLARALAGPADLGPRVLLLDEAFSALDPPRRSQTLDLLLDLREKRGLALLVVSHQQDWLRSFCSRLLEMRDGRLLDP